jgi:hypothetical protein
MRRIGAHAPPHSAWDDGIISTIGFDGQYVMINFPTNIIVLRARLSTPIQNQSPDTKMKLNPTHLPQSNWIATVPNGLGSSANPNITASAFFELVAHSINYLLVID